MKKKPYLCLLRTLREKSGRSQEEVATYLHLSRQTYIKYETGDGDPPVSVLQRLAAYYDVAPGDLLAGEAPQEYHYEIGQSAGARRDAAASPAGVPDMRIAIPQKNVEKFKQVLLYILCSVGAFPNVGETVIYKLLYFIDFDYYELYEEQLMGLSYIRNTHGPTPVDFAKLTRDMQKAGLLEKTETQFFKFKMKKYLPLVKPDLSLLSARELQHIDAVLRKHAWKTAKELSDFSHKDIPWIATKERNVIPYESVFYRTEETSVRIYE